MQTPPIDTCNSPEHKPVRQQSTLSYFLLGLLGLIALSVFFVQGRYDPVRWHARTETATQQDMNSAAAQAETTEPIAVDGLRPMTAGQTYDAANLSDKIDGKAELYLSAGFVKLDSRRYILSGEPTQWLEMFVYDMGRYENAFAVFSRQRRSGVQPSKLTGDAYRTANGIFFVHGKFYSEIIGATTSDILMEKMAELAELWIKNHPVSPSAGLDDPSRFPKDGLVPDTIKLNPANVFGFESFDRIFTAEYQQGDQTATLFLSRRDSAQEAADLAEAYAAFLVTYGGQAITPPADAPKVKIIEIMDTFDMVTSRGPFLAGVHEAADPAYGLALIKALNANLEGSHER